MQVTNDGQPVVLGVDGQTIGGYPKVAQVISADLDKLARLRPGEEVRFQAVSLEGAESLYRQRQVELRRWITRLRTAAGSRVPSDEQDWVDATAAELRAALGAPDFETAVTDGGELTLADALTRGLAMSAGHRIR